MISPYCYGALNTVEFLEAGSEIAFATALIDTVATTAKADRRRSSPAQAFLPSCHPAVPTKFKDVVSACQARRSPMKKFTRPIFSTSYAEVAEREPNMMSGMMSRRETTRFHVRFRAQTRQHCLTRSI